jgi:hypothetical protein
LAIEHIIHPNTGIFQRKVRRLELRTDAESFKDLAKMLPSAANEDPLGINKFESEAEKFLKAYVRAEMGGLKKAIRREIDSAGLDYVVQSYVEKTRDGLLAEFRKGLSEEKNRKLIRKLGKLEQAADACEILNCVSVIRGLMQPGGGEQAAWCILLGRAYERFRVRIFEPKASAGEKILSAASSGGFARTKLPEDYEELASKFRASGLSQRAYARTAGIGRSTLQRAKEKVDSSPAK